MSQRRVTELEWRIEASLCVDARVRDPRANARKVDRKGRAKPLAERNLLNRRRNPAQPPASRLGKDDSLIRDYAIGSIFVQPGAIALPASAPQGVQGRAIAW